MENLGFLQDAPTKTRPGWFTTSKIPIPRNCKWSEVTILCLSPLVVLYPHWLLVVFFSNRELYPAVIKHGNGKSSIFAWFSILIRLSLITYNGFKWILHDFTIFSHDLPMFFPLKAPFLMRISLPKGPPSYALSCRGRFPAQRTVPSPCFPAELQLWIRRRAKITRVRSRGRGSDPELVEFLVEFSIDFIMKSEWIYMILYVHFTMFHHINNKDLTLNIHQ